VELFGRPVSEFQDWSKIGYVRSEPRSGANLPITVEEVVSLGRVARAGLSTL